MANELIGRRIAAPEGAADLPVIAHLVSSPFVGGPELQMLGLAAHLRERWRSVFLPFFDGGLGTALLDAARSDGFDGVALRVDKPQYQRMVAELADVLRAMNVAVLITHHYKADIVGLFAARRLGIPIVSVSHGWVGGPAALYEAADRIALLFVDRVVCVSESQARRIRRYGVRRSRVAVIRNATTLRDDGDASRAAARREVEGLFPRPPRRIVGSAGRLSFEKGFDRLVAAARIVVNEEPDVGFVVFGDGPERAALTAAIERSGLREHFVLGGFRSDLRAMLPAFDVAALSSRTEGMPVVVLEAMAAGIPVVATAVGGTPEVVRDGSTGYLVADGDVTALAARIRTLTGSDDLRRSMGRAGRELVESKFTFDAQRDAYESLLATLPIRGRTARTP